MSIAVGILTTIALAMPSTSGAQVVHGVGRCVIANEPANDSPGSLGNCVITELSSEDGKDASALAPGAIFYLVPSAMRVSPMTLELESTGSGATARFEVQNIGPKDLLYETRVYRIELNDQGEETINPADEDFLVFPPQGVLSTGVSQVVRLQWLGLKLDAPQTYHVSIEQLPVILEPNDSGRNPSEENTEKIKVMVVVKPSR
ncbi:hypothetical protein [Parasphingorhabdus sp.]|uniref:hypothetical protein n=1 Tax=Parasphingorhabdus sp. TaxID=2709688 RepID=UPI003265E329